MYEEKKLPPWRGMIITSHAATYDDPIAVTLGEAITTTDRTDYWRDNPVWLFRWCMTADGKSGWLPEALIGPDSTALADYDARELTVVEGMFVSVTRAYNGWLWCTDQKGASGWVPEDHVQR